MTHTFIPKFKPELNGKGLTATALIHKDDCSTAFNRVFFQQLNKPRELLLIVDLDNLLINIQIGLVEHADETVKFNCCLARNCTSDDIVAEVITVQRSSTEGSSGSCKN